ncbi:hypothetical protein ACFE04_000688 [Oxalis oulophora]
MAEFSSSSSTSHPPPPPLKPVDLHLTIISAKHIKNVNWLNGDLKPYVVFWVDPERRLATKSDDSGSTRPVWNERFTIPIPFLVPESILTLEVFHSKPSETPKPLVGTVRIPLIYLGSDDSGSIKSFELVRPSGRPQGKIRIKISVRESYSCIAPPHQQQHWSASSYYYRAPSPYGAYPPNAYYSSAPPPPIPSRPLFDSNRTSSFGAPAAYTTTTTTTTGPSAPVDYSPYDNQRHQMLGSMGLSVGGVTGRLGRLAVDEEDKTESELDSEFDRRDYKYAGYRY